MKIDAGIGEIHSAATKIVPRDDFYALIQARTWPLVTLIALVAVVLLIYTKLDRRNLWRNPQQFFFFYSEASSYLTRNYSVIISFPNINKQTIKPTNLPKKCQEFLTEGHLFPLASQIILQLVKLLERK